MYVYC